MKPKPPPPSPRPGYAPSPCNGVCTLDEHRVCLGCRRTLDEIVAWAGMTPEQQDAVMRELPDRA